ncbi:hypothetical protein Tco_0520028 [Tanacetum coccineum]
MDPLDFLARSALARDAEYDQILNDDFGTATRGKALDQTITSAEFRRTESLLPLELSNRVNVLSVLLVSHGYELNSRYANLVSSKAHLQEKFNKKKWDIKLLRLEVTSLDSNLENLQRGYDTLGQENRELHSQRDAASEEELTRTDAKLSEKALTVRGQQNRLVLEKSKSQEYKDAMDGLWEEVTQFVGSSVEGLVRKLLSSDEFHAALARVASFGINYGVERGLHMGCTDVEFEAIVQKFSNFRVGAKADFDKALDDFPTTPIPFLSKNDGRLPKVASSDGPDIVRQFCHSATSVDVASSHASKAPEQVSP